MSLSIDWQTSVAASAWHAAERLTRQAPVVDARVADALVEPAAALAGELANLGIDAAAWWAQQLPLAATPVSVRERVEIGLRKAFGSAVAGRAAGPLAGRILPIEQALLRAIPAVSSELELRLPPWRQQWEARGPGLLYGLRRLTETDLLPETARVVLVHPAAGGAGRAFAPYNLVLCEATLTDPEPRLPELVRLGWLLAQLNLDLPRYGDRLPRERLLRAAAWGLAPITLAAAEDAELARADRAGLELAIARWELGGPVNLGEILDTWYGVYRDTRPDFGASLVALDAMLAE